MTRIVGGGGKNPVKSVGRPGFKRISKSGMRRAKQGVVGVMSTRSVRTLFKRNPANRTAIIGTGKDVLGSPNQKWSRTASPTPKIVKKAKPTSTSDVSGERRIERGAANNYLSQRIKKN